MKESVVVQCSWLGDPSIPLKSLEGVRGGRGSRCRDTARSKRRCKESRGRRYEVSRREIKGLKARVGRKRCISRCGPHWTVEVYKLEESREEVTVISSEKAGTQLQEGELPRVLNLEKESSEHFRWTDLEQVQHCTDLSARSHFQRTLNRERRRVKVGMNDAAHQEKEKNEETKTDQRRAAEKKRQAIDFKEAACCPSAVIEGAARRKNGLCEGSAGVTGTLGKANSHFDSTQTVSGTAPPHLGGC